MVGPRTKMLSELTSYRVLAVDGGVDAIAARYETSVKAMWMASARLRAWRDVSEEDFRAQAVAGKSVVVPLPTSEQQWEWEAYRPTEGKLIDVCTARNKDPAASALRTGLPPLTPWSLWRLLMNGQFREAALKDAKDAAHLDQHPEEVSIPPDAVLMIPYPVRPVAGVVAAPPNPKDAAPAVDGGKTVTAVVRPPSDVDPPKGSIYELLDAPLRATLGRSFRQRVLNMANTGENLRPAFAQQPAPRTTWEALDRLTATDLNTLVRIYERITGVDASLWSNVQYLRFGWYTSSVGWAMVWASRDGFAKALGSTSGLCADTIVGDRWHQSKWYKFDCDCWREIVSGSHQEGLHFCLATKGSTGDDNIHIDEVDPASSSDLFDRCEYDLSASIPHLAMVGANQGVSVSPFYAVDLAIAEGWKRINAPGLAGTDKGKDLTARLKEKETHWNEHARAIGCMGKTGFTTARAILDAVNGIGEEAKAP